MRGWWWAAAWRRRAEEKTCIRRGRSVCRNFPRSTIGRRYLASAGHHQDHSKETKMKIVSSPIVGNGGIRQLRSSNLSSHVTKTAKLHPVGWPRPYEGPRIPRSRSCSRGPYRCLSISTCRGIRTTTNWQMTGSIRGQSRIGSGTFHAHMGTRSVVRVRRATEEATEPIEMLLRRP